jgi:hypothetical protein
MLRRLSFKFYCQGLILFLADHYGSVPLPAILLPNRIFASRLFFFCAECLRLQGVHTGQTWVSGLICFSCASRQICFSLLPARVCVPNFGCRRCLYSFVPAHWFVSQGCLPLSASGCVTSTPARLARCPVQFSFSRSRGDHPLLAVLHAWALFGLCLRLSLVSMVFVFPCSYFPRSGLGSLSVGFQFQLDMDVCRWFPVLLLSHRIKRPEDLWFKSYFHGDFPNSSTRCSVKCLWGSNMFFRSIFIIDLARCLASTIPCLCSSS